MAEGPGEQGTGVREPASPGFERTSAEVPGAEVDDDDDDENETCGFCKYMKGGPCRDAFTGWMKCIDKEKAAGNDYVETCMQQIFSLRECMMANSGYYAPMLEEEQQFVNDRGEEDARGEQGARGEQDDEGEGVSDKPQSSEAEASLSRTPTQGDQRREDAKTAEPTHPSDKPQDALPAHASELPQSVVPESGCNSLPNS